MMKTKISNKTFYTVFKIAFWCLWAWIFLSIFFAANSSARELPHMTVKQIMEQSNPLCYAHGVVDVMIDSSPTRSAVKTVTITKVNPQWEAWTDTCNQLMDHFAEFYNGYNYTEYDVSLAPFKIGDRVVLTFILTGKTWTLYGVGTDESV